MDEVGVVEEGVVVGAVTGMDVFFEEEMGVGDL